MDKKQETKREIIKHAINGRRPDAKTADGPNYPSKASRGIYRSGPWSDSLDTTYAKVDKNLASKLNVQQTPPGEITGSRISSKPAAKPTKKPSLEPKKKPSARMIPPGVIRIGKTVGSLPPAPLPNPTAPGLTPLPTTAQGITTPSNFPKLNNRTNKGQSPK